MPRLITLPGHSAGSIGILASTGGPSNGSDQVLFCGDLLDNSQKLVLNSIMDDLAAANASLEKLRSLEISTIFPGHGQSFQVDLLPQAAPGR